MYKLQQMVAGEWVTIKTCDSAFVASMWCDEYGVIAGTRRYVLAV